MSVAAVARMLIHRQRGGSGHGVQGWTPCGVTILECRLVDGVNQVQHSGIRLLADPARVLQRKVELLVVTAGGEGAHRVPPLFSRFCDIEFLSFPPVNPTADDDGLVLAKALAQIPICTINVASGYRSVPAKDESPVVLLVLGHVHAESPRF